MLLLGHIILKETPIYLVICLVTYNFNRWGFSVQPILRVFNTLKHIHTNTSTHLSATTIKMTLFIYVSRYERTSSKPSKKDSCSGAFFILWSHSLISTSFFFYLSVMSYFKFVLFRF